MRANYKVDFIWYYGYIIQDSKCVLHARIRTAEVVQLLVKQSTNEQVLCFRGFLPSNNFKNCSFQRCCLTHHPGGTIHTCVVYVTCTPGIVQYTYWATVCSSLGSFVGTSKKYISQNWKKKIFNDHLVWSHLKNMKTKTKSTSGVTFVGNQQLSQEKKPAFLAALYRVLSNTSQYCTCNCLMVYTFHPKRSSLYHCSVSYKNCCILSNLG